MGRLPAKPRLPPTSRERRFIPAVFVFAPRPRDKPDGTPGGRLVLPCRRTIGGGIINTSDDLRTSRSLLAMRRISAAIAVSIRRRCPAGEVKIAWYGQSMFEIVTSKGTRIITDPQSWRPTASSR